MLKNVLEGHRWLQRAGLQRQTVDARERLRDVAGAALGLWLTALVGGWAWGSDGLWLAAPMGASAVLLFAVPSSPLAQPWPVIVGNAMAACVGVAMARILGPTPLAAALAGALALALMFPLRCVHPPGGAVAITAVVGGPAIHALGFGFALHPVAVNSAVLVGVALLWRRWPRPARRAPGADPVPPPGAAAASQGAPPATTVGLAADDLDAALRHFNELVDIDRNTLEQLLADAQLEAWQRHFGALRCADIMHRDVTAVVFATPLQEAWSLMHRHRLRALPVVDRARRVIGQVTMDDFLAHAGLDPVDHRSVAQRVRALLAPTPTVVSNKAEVVGQIMTSPVPTLDSQAPMMALVQHVSRHGLRPVLVVDDERRLAGQVAPPDLVAALVREPLEGRAPAA